MPPQPDLTRNAVNTNQPKHLVKLSTTYELPGALKRFTVGGTLTWQSSTYFQQAGSPYYRANESAYALVGLMARYVFDNGLSLSANVIATSAIYAVVLVVFFFSISYVAPVQAPPALTVVSIQPEASPPQKRPEKKADAKSVHEKRQQISVLSLGRADAAAAGRALYPLHHGSRRQGPLLTVGAIVGLRRARPRGGRAAQTRPALAQAAPGSDRRDARTGRPRGILPVIKASARPLRRAADDPTSPQARRNRALRCRELG